MHKHIDGCANASARASCSQQDALELLQDWDCSLPHVLDKKQVLLVWIMPFLIPRSAVTSAAVSLPQFFLWFSLVTVSLCPSHSFFLSHSLPISSLWFSPVSIFSG